MKELDSYLNDHVAGSVGALQLLEDCADVHKHEPLGVFFSDIKAEIHADQNTLHDMMDLLEVKRSNLRKAGAWAAEKVGQARSMIAGEDSDGFGLVLTFEGLIMGITGKTLLWRTLGAANLPQLKSYDFEELQRRAERQIERIEAERIRVIQQAFANRIG